MTILERFAPLCSGCKSGQFHDPCDAVPLADIAEAYESEIRQNALDEAIQACQQIAEDDPGLVWVEKCISAIERLKEK